MKKVIKIFFTTVIMAFSFLFVLTGCKNNDDTYIECNNCGAQVDEDSKYCPDCGSIIEIPSSSEPSQDESNINDNKPNDDSSEIEDIGKETFISKGCFTFAPRSFVKRFDDVDKNISEYNYTYMRMNGETSLFYELIEISGGYDNVRSVGMMSFVKSIDTTLSIEEDFTENIVTKINVLVDDADDVPPILVNCICAVDPSVDFATAYNLSFDIGEKTGKIEGYTYNGINYAILVDVEYYFIIISIEDDNNVNSTECDVLGHNWKNATCTSPMTCERCGLTSGKSLGHDWGNPTCITPRSCCICFAVDPNSKPLGHSFEEGTCMICGVDDPDYFVLTSTTYDITLETDNFVAYITMIGGDTVVYNIDNTDIVLCEWGDWEGDIVPLTFIPLSAGKTFVSVYIEETDITICINVTVLEHSHQYDLTTINPTCTEQGYTIYECDCGDNYTSNYKDALSHSFKNGACTLCSAMDVDSKNEEIQAENERYEQAIADNTSVFMDLISETEDEIAYRKSEYNISYVYDSDYCRQRMSEIEEEMKLLKKYIDVYSTGEWDDSVKAKLQKYKVQYAEYKEQYDKYEQMLIINGLYEDIDYYQEEYEECLIELEEIHNTNLEAINKKYECAVKGHTIILDEEVKPTCAKTGLTEGSHCSNCGYIVVAKNTIDKLAHTEVIDEPIDATCTNSGLTEGKHCSVCDEILIVQEEIPALGHTEVIDEPVDATCTSTGLTEGKHCSVCDEVFITQEEIPTIDHEFVDGICDNCGHHYYTEGLVFIISDDGKTYSVSDYTGVEKNVSIPLLYNKKQVISIGAYAFENCSFITSITISNNILSIGSHAFKGCSSLTSIIIPDSVLSIDGAAFVNCSSLNSITLAKSVSFIGFSAFSGCDALDAVYYEGTVEDWCNITLKNLTSTPLYHTSNFYMLDKNNEWYKVEELEITLTETITAIGDYQFYNFSFLTNITLSNSVTSIGYDAFYKCTSLANIVIPSSVMSIDGWAFYRCTSLQNIVIPYGVEIIENGLFSNCSSLISITIPDSVTSIDNYAFASCNSLTDIYYDGSEEEWNTISIGDYNKGLDIGTLHFKLNLEYQLNGDSYEVVGIGTVTDAEIVIPSTYKGLSVTGIGGNAFSRCSFLTSIAISEGVTSIGNYAFYYCSALTNIEIPNSVTIIGNDAFYKCSSLISITIPSNITSIGNRAFDTCTSLESVIIGNSVTNIGEDAFAACTSLKSIIIPSSVTNIGNYAFYNCRLLQNVYYKGTEEQWDAITIGSENSYLTSATIHYNYVPEE